MRCTATWCIEFSAIKKETATAVLCDQWKANSPACISYSIIHIFIDVCLLCVREWREKKSDFQCVDTTLANIEIVYVAIKRAFFFSSCRDSCCRCCGRARAHTHAHSRSTLEHFVFHVLAASKSAKAATVRTFTSLSFRSFLDYVHMVKYR